MKKHYLILLCLLGIHLFLLFNLRFTAWPEMMSYPYLRNHGFLLYKDMIHPYPPVLTMTLSYLYTLFGYKVDVLKAFTWSIILTNDFLIYLIIKKVTGKNIFAFFSLFFYISTQSFLEGNQLWFDLAIVPPILLTTYFMLQKISLKNLVITGFALAIAALIKQTAAIYLVFSFFYLVFQNTKIKNFVYFLIGPFVLVLALILRLISEGAVGGFINWTLKYPFLYWRSFPGYIQMNLDSWQIRILILLFAPVLFFVFKERKNLLKDKNFLLITCYLLLSLVLIYPRFSFFHFQLPLAFIAIILGTLLSRETFSLILLATYYLLLLTFVVRPALTSDWGKETRFWEKGDFELANKISKEVAPEETVFLLGPQSGLYIMSNRLPPKPWADNFGWYLEIHGVQEGIISRWTQNSPDKVIWQDPTPGNWYDLGTYQPKEITGWITKNYTKKSEIEKGVWLWQKD